MRQPGDRAPAPQPLVLVQDLANTADLEAGRDALRTVDDLDVFCVDHGLGEIGGRPEDVVSARELREAVRDACQAHTGVDLPEASARTLDRLFGRAPLVLAMDATGGARAVPAPGLAGADVLTAAVAAAVLAASADGTWLRLKACEAHQCRWVYYDHSPAGRGRWCTMSICGSRAKMRAYRGRSPR
jgi:predicted RNA-binding Zn ribbon-like protein